MSCKHKWITIEKDIIPSPLARVKEKQTLGNFSCAHEAILSTYICILQCTECGKLNKTIEKV